MRVAMQHQYINDNITQTLRTDAEGKVVLGRLSDVPSLNVTLNPSGSFRSVSKSFQLTQSCLVNYPQTITLAEGSAVILPVVELALDQNLYSLREVLTSQG